MKKFYAFLFAASISVFAANAQVVAIGTDVTVPTSGNQYRSPWTAVYDYSYVQTIYLQSEINTLGNITSISYKFDGPSLANSNQLEVYMGITNKSEFDGSYTDWVPTSAMTMVFDGTVTAPALPDWVTITLTTPFNYQNSGNLVIAIHEKSDGSDYVSGLDGNAFEVTDMGTNRVMYFVTDADDGDNPDPNNPPEADNMRSKIGNIRIMFGYAAPVLLNNFTVVKQNNGNSLKWDTRTEQNNKGFDIQRSTDGSQFSSIGFVNSQSANGNSNGVLNYSFLDLKSSAGTNYYRLNQVDFDGKSSLSKIVSVQNNGSNLSIQAIYPNPVQSDLNLVLNSQLSKNVQIVITNMEGQVMYKGAKSLSAGENKISINTSAFSNGVYNVKATFDGTNESALSRFVKR